MASKTSVDPGAAPAELRKPMAWWDRVKFLVLIAIAFLFLVLADFGGSPIKAFQDSIIDTAMNNRWLVVLFGLELVRQLHFVLTESNPTYYAFWKRSIFGRAEARLDRMDPWSRYRLARLLKALAVLGALSVVLGAVFDVSPLTALFELPYRLVDHLPTILQYALAPFFLIFQFVGLFWFLSRGGVDTYFPDDIDTRFGDVWGQDAVLERVKENMVFLEDPESIEERGGFVPGGILLWGPPGTGKTLIAEAVAGETGRPFVFVDPGAFQSMFMGVGVMKVKGLFRKVRRLALRYGGVIMFLDEADSLGNRGQLAGVTLGQGTSSPWSDHSRWFSPSTRHLLLGHSGGATDATAPAGRIENRFMMGGGGGSGTLQALLSEMSGLKKPRGILNRHVRRALGMRPKPPPKYRILIMMATNMPEALDEALLRPGRIDRTYKVGYPSKEGRKRTYRGYLSKVQHDLDDNDVDKLATMTPFATGAVIKDLVNEALINAIRHDRDAITWEDILEAKRLKDLGPPEDVEYIERERHAVAVHEASHAIAAYFLRRHARIDLATIEKGGNYLGMVSSVLPEDQHTQWRSEFEADIMVALASLAGERMFFNGDNSSGVAADLEGATQLATYMEGYFGMGATITSQAISKKMGLSLGGSGKSEEDAEKLLEGSLGERVETNLARLYRAVDALLTEHRLEVLAVAHALEKHKTLSGDDIAAIVDGVPGPLVDGTAYHVDRFRELAEEYHAVAALAHDEHTGVRIPLPEIPTPVGAGLVDVVASSEGNRRLDPGHPSLNSGSVGPSPESSSPTK